MCVVPFPDAVHTVGDHSTGVMRPVLQIGHHPLDFFGINGADGAAFAEAPFPLGGFGG